MLLTKNSSEMSIRRLILSKSNLKQLQSLNKKLSEERFLNKESSKEDENSLKTTLEDAMDSSEDGELRLR
jgi:hypothetical protein